jgi:hypothetical protein
MGGMLVQEGMCPGLNNSSGPSARICPDGSIVDANLACPYEAAATDPPHKGGWNTNPRGAGRTAWQYLTSIWKDCLEHFNKDNRFDSSHFSYLLNNGIIWYDTRGSDGKRTVGSVVGNGDPTTLKESVGSSNAVVLGDFTRNVALGSNYFQDNTQTQQIATAIHEALHIQMRMDDSTLKGWLSNFGFEPSSIGTAEISDWIAKGCK